MVSYFDHLLTNITKNGRDDSTKITSDQNGKVLYDQTQGYLSISLPNSLGWTVRKLTESVSNNDQLVG